MAAAFAAFDAAVGSGSCLLAWFVDCATLTTVRDGRAPVMSLFGRYGLFVTPVNEAGLVQRFPGMTRADFVQQIAASLPSFDRALLSVTVDKTAAVQAGAGGLAIAAREIGLLGVDRHAYYLATATELTHAGDTRLLAGVAATTLVHEVAVSTIVYGGLEGAGTLATLEQTARAATLALIEANPGGDGGGRGFSLDATRTLLIGFAIGLVFIAIGLVNLAWKWWCRRYGLQP
jgi:hypothetical protein